MIAMFEQCSFDIFVLARNTDVPIQRQGANTIYLSLSLTNQFLTLRIERIQHGPRNGEQVSKLNLSLFYINLKKFTTSSIICFKI